MKKMSQAQSSIQFTGSNYDNGSSKWHVRYGNFVRKLQIPTEVQSSIKCIDALVKDNSFSGGHGMKSKTINTMLDEICQDYSIDSVLSHVDDSGFDLLQTVSGAGLHEVVAHILEIGYNIHLLNRACSNPLHIACKQGHTNVIELFLKYGADINSKSTVCYPIHHFTQAPSTTEHAYYHPNQNDCIDRKLSLLNLALYYDNISIVQVLMKPENLKCLDTHLALYHACRYNAIKCLEFIVPLFPEQVNSRINYHSLLSWAFTKSFACGKIVLESNLKWDEKILLHVNMSGESILHLILSYPFEDNFYEIVKYTVENCLPRQHINTCNQMGDTPFLIVLTLIGHKYIYKKGFSKQKYNKEWNEQIFQIIQFLVEQGADIHVTNSGRNALHALLQNLYETRYCVQYPSYYKNVLPEISRVLEYLITMHVDVDVSSVLTASPLTWVTQSVSSLSVFTFDQTWPSFSYLFQLLLTNGANPNALDEKGIHIINIIFTTLDRWLNQCDSTSLAYRTLSRIASFVTLLFAHGMTLPQDILELSIKQIMLLCNIKLTAKVMQDSQLLIKYICSLFIPFITHGVDPHQLNMVTEKQMDTVPCKLTSQLYLSRAFIIHWKSDAMMHFVEILETSLDQKHLHGMMSSICTVLSQNFEDDSNISHCKELLQSTLTNARSLQKLCKVTICRQLKWHLSDNVPRLHLPKTLQKFLMYYVNY